MRVHREAGEANAEAIAAGLRARGVPAIDHRGLQENADRAGRECVVGAAILDAARRVFVQRRSWDRKLLPGCWDIVGGHVERGEGLLEALAREVQEETGWSLAAADELLLVADWETDDGGRVRRRREFDYLVRVTGDRSRPRLEEGKHTEYRWIGPDDLSLLSENRGADDGMVLRIVQRALESHARASEDLSR